MKIILPIVLLALSSFDFSQAIKLKEGQTKTLKERKSVFSGLKNMMAAAKYYTAATNEEEIDIAVTCMQGMLIQMRSHNDKLSETVIDGAKFPLMKELAADLLSPASMLFHL